VKITKGREICYHLMKTDHVGKSLLKTYWSALCYTDWRFENVFFCLLMKLYIEIDFLAQICYFRSVYPLRWVNLKAVFLVDYTQWEPVRHVRACCKSLWLETAVELSICANGWDLLRQSRGKGVTDLVTKSWQSSYVTPTWVCVKMSQSHTLLSSRIPGICFPNQKNAFWEITIFVSNTSDEKYWEAINHLMLLEPTFEE